MTTARWLRQFVQSHPLYKHDSVVSEEVRAFFCLFTRVLAITWASRFATKNEEINSFRLAMSSRGIIVHSLRLNPLVELSLSHQYAS